ncbi:MAG: hypothetical protein ACRDZV_10775 [Acidimicrobiia bacterium]
MTALVCLAAATLVLVAGAASADTTIRVDENGEAGWLFNPDPGNATDFEFSLEQASIGTGSAKGGPIGPAAAEKLIGGKELGLPVTDLSSIAYDFLVAGNGTAASGKHFYLNVYANIDDSDNFYDCRFDYVPLAGSTTAFTTMTVTPTDVPTTVTKRGARFDGLCPATLAGMPEGSHVRAIALNIGDTGVSDNGLAGYLDNVQIATTSETTTYDFEASPGTPDECKKDGWAAFGFPNQGACVSSLQSNGNAGK